MRGIWLRHHVSNESPITRIIMSEKPIRRDRARMHSAKSVDRKIDAAFECSLRHYATTDEDTIRRRLDELDREWDMERAVELNASALALTGTVLGLLVNRKWFSLPLVVTGFLLNHAVRGWCPPVPVFRRMGVRACKEIERERYALLALCGRFREAERNPDAILATLHES